MNILIICERENNPFIGGIEHVDYSLTREWLKAGSNVVWLSVRNSGANIPYTPLADEYFMPDGNQADAQANEDLLFSLIEKYKIQIIVNQATIRKDVVALCYQAKMKTGVKLVSCFHFAPNVEYDIAKNNVFLFKDGFTVKALLRNCYSFLSFYLYRGRKLKNKEKNVLQTITSSSDIVVVESERYIADFEKISGSKKFIAIHNAMDYVQVDGLPKKEKKILYCARLEFGMKRNFLGFANPKPYYESCPVICLTSTKEGSPMVVVEAMQYGCVPIAYDSFAALADVVDNGVTGATGSRPSASPHMWKNSRK